MIDDFLGRLREKFLNAIPASLALNDEIKSRITVGPPRDPSHGDMTTNAAMIAGTFARRNPRDIASQIVETLQRDSEFSAISVAGPGFINFSLVPAAFHAVLPAILRAGESYGDSATGNGKTVNVEYVS